MQRTCPYHICLCQKAASFGGVERFICELASWLADKDVKVSIVSNHPEVFSDHLPDNDRVSAVLGLPWQEPTLSLRQAMKACRLFRRLRADAVLFNHTKNCTFVSSVVGSRMAGVRHVVHFYHNILTADPSFRRRRVFPPRELWATRALVRLRIVAACADALVFNNRLSVENVVNAYHVPARKVHYMDLGTDTQRFRPNIGAGREQRRLLGLSEGAFVLGSSCRLSKEKGLVFLLEAVARAREARPEANICCVILGEGPQRDELALRAGQLGIGGRVIFTGFVANVHEMLNALDAFALVSSYEPFGLSLIEAMSTGLPCIATRVGGMQDIITDGKDGYLVDSGDHEALKDRIVGLADAPERRRELGAEARRTALRRFRHERVWEGLAHFLGAPGYEAEP